MPIVFVIVHHLRWASSAFGATRWIMNVSPTVATFRVVTGHWHMSNARVSSHENCAQWNYIYIKIGIAWWNSWLICNESDIKFNLLDRRQLHASHTRFHFLFHIAPNSEQTKRKKKSRAIFVAHFFLFFFFALSFCVCLSEWNQVAITPVKMKTNNNMFVACLSQWRPSLFGIGLRMRKNDFFFPKTHNRTTESK